MSLLTSSQTWISHVSFQQRGQMQPGLHWYMCNCQVQQSDPSCPFGTCNTASEVVYWVLVSVQTDIDWVSRLCAARMVRSQNTWHKRRGSASRNSSSWRREQKGNAFLFTTTTWSDDKESIKPDHSQTCTATRWEAIEPSQNWLGSRKYFCHEGGQTLMKFSQSSSRSSSLEVVEI